MSKSRRAPRSKLRLKSLGFESLETRTMMSLPPALPDPNVTLTTTDVDTLLRRAVASANTSNAIIAVVDRNGTILGVQVEPGALASVAPDRLDFAIDGAVAEARTGAFFSNNDAKQGVITPSTIPIDLTSRTIRQISQTTITAREVQADPDPNVPDPTQQGPGFVAPIGVGGHFPADIAHTPPVDLFEIEGTNRAVVAPNGQPYGEDPANIAQSIPSPVAYGVQSGDPGHELDIGRGIGTLPGGIGLFKANPANPNQSILVGGIGVFFPGPTGYADVEQNFQPTNKKQTALQRENAPLALLAEYMAFAAAGGAPGVAAGITTKGPGGQTLPALPGFQVPLNPKFKVFLAGIALDQVGQGSAGGVKQTLKTGKTAGQGVILAPGAGSNKIVQGGMMEIPGAVVPTGILITPHASSVPGGLTEPEVEQIINQAITTANQTRAQLRVAPTDMAIAVTDTTGEVLGLYRMTDSTIFSIDVAVAKARNVAYYASPDLQPEDRVAVNDLLPVSATNPFLPLGTAFTSRTFRFLVEPRYPAGVDGSVPGAFSILREDWVDPKTGYNKGAPAPISDIHTVLGYDAFHPGTNFHATTDPNFQNGVVFFPGSSPLYVNQVLVGGFGVSGDGVDQDDVVSFFGAQGFAAPTAIRADQFFVRKTRLPYQKFSRNAFQL